MARPVQASRILFAFALLACLLLVVQGLADRLIWLTPGLPFGVNYDPVQGRLFLQDFAYNFGVTKAAVRGTIATPYTEEGQLDFMRQWTGRDFGLALGYGYSPTLWLLFSPLLALPTLVAYVVWSLAPVLLLLAAATKRLGRDLDERDRFSLLLLIILFGSASYRGEVELGKTVVVLGMITFALIETRRREHDAGTAALLFLLTATPPLAVAMGAGLFADRRPRPVLAALGLVAIEVACVALWLGPGWTRDYVYLISHYTSDTAPESFRPFLRPDGMSNVRHLLVTAGWADHAAATASVVTWAATIAAALAMRDRLRPGPLRLSLALLAFTIFSPHLTFSNDLLVVIAVWFVHADVDLGAPTRALLAGLLIVIVDCGPSKAFLLNDAGANLALAAKLAVTASLVAVGRSSEARST